MEIKIIAPTNGQPLPAVEWNYTEVKQWLEDGLAAYKGRVYTEETVTEAKKDRANLNKLADAIAGKRKEMKAMYLQPYEEFEAQAKELEAMVKNQSAEIDAQVKTFENFKKEEKLKNIKEMYSGMIGNLAGLVPYDKLHNPKWLNVSTSETAIATELSAKIDRIIAGLSSIDSLNLEPDIAEQVKGAFLKDFDLAAALAERERIEKQRAELAAYEARKSTQQNEGKYTPAETVQSAEVKAETAEPTTTEVHTETEQEIHTVAFRVWATSEQLEALKSFLKNNNIKYGRA